MRRLKMCSSRLQAAICGKAKMANRKYSPIWQITLSRLKEFTRAPGAVFWVYGFPIIMMMSLGTAFRDNPKEHIAVDVVGEEVQGSKFKVQSHDIKKLLERDPRFAVSNSPGEDWKKRLQAGKT